MEEQPYTLEPISRIHGNIEITHNSKDETLDPYEPLDNQIVFTVGKSGRANRLTFENPSSETLHELADTVKEIALKVENELEYEQTDEEFDIDPIESGVSDESTFDKVEKARKLLKEKTESEVDKEDLLVEVSEQSNLKKEGVKNELEQLMRDGLLFEPEPGKVVKMS